MARNSLRILGSDETSVHPRKENNDRPNCAHRVHLFRFADSGRSAMVKIDSLDSRIDRDASRLRVDRKRSGTAREEVTSLPRMVHRRGIPLCDNRLSSRFSAPVKSESLLKS